ncbi:MAG: riboflavin synthase [bacterium]|nr:riboflavin synthase [bacterium]
MFTGIITHTGTVAGKTRNTLAIRAERDILRALKRGDSIAVDGMCLTVTSKNTNSFSADVMSATFRRTNFSSLTAKSIVNLELPVTPQTFLSGHIVQGHVDAVGTVRQIKKDGNQFTLSISVPKQISRYIVPKGSVTVNGVSLTAIDAKSGSFSVGIIPHTWKSTMFHTLKKKSPVNIEVDILAKYVERLITKKYI